MKDYNICKDNWKLWSDAFITQFLARGPGSTLSDQQWNDMNRIVFNFGRNFEVNATEIMMVADEVLTEESE